MAQPLARHRERLAIPLTAVAAVEPCGDLPTVVEQLLAPRAHRERTAIADERKLGTAAAFDDAALVVPHLGGFGR